MVWQGVMGEWSLSALPEALGGTSVREAVQLRRGLFTPELRRRYFEGGLPDLGPPHKLPDIEKAINLVHQATTQKTLVFIAGDYDVDGISSAAIWARFFKRHGVPYVVRLPTREEGYGLSQAIIREALACHPALFISVDCGTKNPAEIARLKAANIPTLICDHHLVPPDPAIWPQADAFVNPHRPDAEDPCYQELTAAGVVFKLLHAYYLMQGTGGHLHALEEVLELVGIATLADVASIGPENRLLTRLALQKLQTEPSLGLKALLRKLGLEGRPLESRDIVFRIVPRLNAAGRLDKPDPALQLLLAEKEQPALALIQQLEHYNTRRQAYQEAAVKAAEKQLYTVHGTPANWPSALFVRDPSWHKGIIGLVAAKLTEKYERPAAALTKDPQTGLWVGSARSVPAVPLQLIIETLCRPYLIRGGGHAMAAGFSLEEATYQAFYEAFLEGVRSHLRTVPRTRFTLDAQVTPVQILSEDLAGFTHQFEPVGPGNPAPRYLLTEVHLRPQNGKWMVYSKPQDGKISLFEARLTFTSHRWETQRETLLGTPLYGLIVTPSRVTSHGPVMLKVRDLILDGPPADL